MAGPVGMSDSTGLDLLDRMYEPVADDATSRRASRVAFAVTAGGEV